jgi:hypothetical protein
MVIVSCPAYLLGWCRFPSLVLLGLGHISKGSEKVKKQNSKFKIYMLQEARV